MCCVAVCLGALCVFHQIELHIKDLNDGIKKGDTSSTLDRDEKQDTVNNVDAASEVQLAVIEGKPASVVKAALNHLRTIGEVDIPDPQIVVLSKRSASENASQGKLERWASVLFPHSEGTVLRRLVRGQV